MKILICCFVAILGLSSLVFSQTDKPVSKQGKPDPKWQENHRVESKVSCVLISDFKYEETTLTVKLKNICRDKIMTIRYRAANQSGMLPRFQIKPDEERELVSPFGGYNVEQGLIVEAVLFENGEGDGEPEKIKSLQMVFNGSRNELQKIIEILNSAIENPSENGKTILSEVKKQLEKLPDEYVDFKKVGMGGAMLMMGKLNYYGRISEIEAKKDANDVNFVVGELQKLKTEIEKTLEVYPKITEQ